MLEEKLSYIKNIVWSSDIWIYCTTIFDIMDYIKEQSIDLESKYCSKCMSICETENNEFNWNSCIECGNIMVLPIVNYLKVIRLKEKWNIIDIRDYTYINVLYAIVYKQETDNF